MIKHESLRSFQWEHKRWLDHNFPGQESLDGLVGMVEELGELAEATKQPIPLEIAVTIGKLCHAALKAKQGIRGNEDHREEAEDAIGDLFIYMASFCNTNGYDMATCLERAWEEVRARDWQAHRETGVDTEQPTGEV